MDELLFLLVIPVIVIPVIVLIFLILIKSQLSDNNRIVKHLQRTLADIQRQLNTLQYERPPVKESPQAERSMPQQEERPPAATPVREIPPSYTPVITEKKKQEEITPIIPPQPEEKIETKEEVSIPAPALQEVEQKPVEEQPPVVEQAAFSQVEAPAPPPVENIIVPPPPQHTAQPVSKDKSDLEKFIGENLINKIGIAVLVLGIAFFVKYAIDQDWIGEVGRVCIGLLCGAILTGIAHRLRKNYRAFSSVMAGGGIAVFYFTIAFAFQSYQLFSAATAFLIMIVITIFGVLLSVFYNRVELAVLATIGGFITPYLVSTGQGNYVILFTYLAILNTGLIVLALYKQWRIVNLLSFVFTVMLYGGWILTKSGTSAFSYGGTFLFGTLFYAMFMAMNIISHFRDKGTRRTFDYFMMIAINLLYYAAGYYLLTDWNMGDYKGLFTAALGIVNLVLAFVIYKKESSGKNYIYLLVGITLTFITLAAPVQLHGNYITMFWAAEMVVLYWLYQKSGIRLMKIASSLVAALMFVSLLIDWIQLYVVYRPKLIMPVITNRALITSIICVLALLLMKYLTGKKPEETYAGPIKNKFVTGFYLASAVIVLFISGLLEVNYQYSARYPEMDLHVLYNSLYLFAFAYIMCSLLQLFRVKIPETVYLVSGLLLLIIYCMSASTINGIGYEMLSGNKYRGHFGAHWIGVLFLLMFIIKTIRVVTKDPGSRYLLPAFSVIASIGLVILFSIEVGNLFIWMRYTDKYSIYKLEGVYNKAGLSIVWGVCSFVAIWLGMKFRFKALRIVGLLLFGITLVKLFLFDIRNISPAGKIIAFISLGVLLLIVSFMYQRLKKLLIDDKNNSQ